jgi:ABC-type glycerol-3-phosphate transport system permease component
MPLVVPAFFGNAFFIFMYRQFIAQIPESLVEAARVDGLGPIAIWWRIILPLCRPVTAICAVFTFIGTWNDFMGPLVYLHAEEQSTLAVALNSFRNQYGGVTKVHLLMAASIVTMVPCILLFLAAQRQFIEGLGKGAVKG